MAIVERRAPPTPTAALPTPFPRLLAPAAALLTVLAVLTAQRPAAAQPPRTDRIGGRDRIATAAAIAERTFPDGSVHAILARAGDFPDALAGSAVAGYLTAPILLTPRDRLAERSARELADLGVDRVSILGNATAISAEIEQDLQDRGYETVRFGGATRFETAAAIARGVRDGIGAIDGLRAAFLAYGGDFADALAVGPGADANVNPVLLTTTDDLHPAAEAALSDLGIELTIIVGGTAVVSDDVRDRVEALGIEARRVGGRDRTDTAQLVATHFEQHLGFDRREVLIARGDAYPDALAAAPHGAALDAPVLLARSPGQVSYDQLQWLVDRAEGIELVRGLGGDAALTPGVLQRLADAAAPPQRTLTYTVGTRGDVSSDVALFAENVDWTLTDQRGWSLDNDIRWTHLGDEPAADVNIYLATGSAIEQADPGCSAQWSCQPAGTNDVYINQQHWEHSTASFRGERSLDDYRHYVVLHELGHAPPMDFGHIRCGEHYSDPDGDPAPVMEQQSKQQRVGERCMVNVWPLPAELDAARDRILGGSPSTQGSHQDDRTHAP